MERLILSLLDLLADFDDFCCKRHTGSSDFSFGTSFCLATTSDSFFDRVLIVLFSAFICAVLLHIPCSRFLLFNPDFNPNLACVSKNFSINSASRCCGGVGGTRNSVCISCGFVEVGARTIAWFEVLISIRYSIVSFKDSFGIFVRLTMFNLLFLNIFFSSNSFQLRMSLLKRSSLSSCLKSFMLFGSWLTCL